jgi:hypothetical protein
MATGVKDLVKILKKPGHRQIFAKMATGLKDLGKFQRNLDLDKFSRKWQQV